MGCYCSTSLNPVLANIHQTGFLQVLFDWCIPNPLVGGCVGVMEG